MRSLLFVLCLILVSYTNVQAQNVGAGLYKKLVRRIINIPILDDNKQHNLESAGDDRPLGELIVREIKEGKLPAYSISDNKIRLTKDDIDKLTASTTDTLTTDEPDPEFRAVIRTVDFNYKKYKAIYHRAMVFRRPNRYNRNTHDRVGSCCICLRLC